MAENAVLGLQPKLRRHRADLDGGTAGRAAAPATAAAAKADPTNGPLEVLVAHVDAVLLLEPIAHRVGLVVHPLRAVAAPLLQQRLHRGDVHFGVVVRVAAVPARWATVAAAAAAHRREVAAAAKGAAADEPLFLAVVDRHVKVKLEAVAHRVRRVVVVLAAQLRALLDQRLHRGDVDRRVVARLTDVAKVATAAALEAATAAAATVVEARIVAIVVKAAAAGLGLAAHGASVLRAKTL